MFLIRGAPEYHDQLVTLKADINAGGAGTITVVSFAMLAASIADIYNDPAEAVGSPTVDVRYATVGQMIASVDETEYSALTVQERNLWSDMLLAAADVGLSVDDAGIRALVASIWPAGSTRNALVALQTRAATPAEILFGVGVEITAVDVQRAENWV